jgi:hypothetical protein
MSSASSIPPRFGTSRAPSWVATTLMGSMRRTFVSIATPPPTEGFHAIDALMWLNSPSLSRDRKVCPFSEPEAQHQQLAHRSHDNLFGFEAAAGLQPGHQCNDSRIITHRVGVKPRSPKGRAAARGLDARPCLQHLSRPAGDKPTKNPIDRNHGIYRDASSSKRDFDDNV